MSSKTGTVRTTQRRLRFAEGHDAGAAGLPTTTALSEALPRLATALDDAAEQAGWGARPTLVRVTAWPSKPLSHGFDLGVRPVDDDLSVVEALAGVVAPAEWMAIGVITEGNARHLVEACAERRRVRCVHLVDRTGASASALRLQGDPATTLVEGDEHAPRGRIDDVCRRALGLATAPAERTTIELWALVWLDRLVSALAAAPPEVRWRHLVELHPAVALLVEDDAHWAEQAAGSLTRLGTLLAEVHSWPVLRAGCAAGDWPVVGVPPDVAAWLDDGAFSRWVLGTFPPIDQLAAAACDLLTPSLSRRLRAALRAWQLP